MSRTARDFLPLAIVGLLCLVALLLWLVRRSPGSPPPPAQVQAPEPPATPPLPVRLDVEPLPPTVLQSAAIEPDGRVLATAPDGAELELTLDGTVQAEIAASLDRLRLPYAAVVLIDPQTGAIRAAVERKERGDPVGQIGSLTEARIPAASVFKVVTSAALLEAGQTPDAGVCFHGGRHGIDPSTLRDGPRDACTTLSEALARSTNAAFARFAVRDLQPGALEDVAARLGFNRPVPGDLLGSPSMADEGQSEVDRGRTAAGFAGSTLSPLHGALLAAAVAHGGVAMRPYLVQRASTHPGLDREPEPLGQVLAPHVAADLARMMVRTTTEGTGRNAFSKRPLSLRDVTVAGKTGSLSGDDPAIFRHYTWFVGFAPADRPQVAVAALAVNGWQWKAKAPALARDALGVWFARHGQSPRDEGPQPPAAEASARGKGNPSRS